jgi:D-lactate dehydrogenase
MDVGRGSAGPRRESSTSTIVDPKAKAISGGTSTNPDVHALLTELRRAVGRGHVLTQRTRTRNFRRGYRYGEGEVIAVVRPANLVQCWRVASICVRADVSMIIQAANTGLTGGSTPNGNDYPNGVIIINTRRIKGIHLLDGGRQVVCLPGTTLYELENALLLVEREPHSVIGSSCIGASVIGGICNNSGGALVQRGPAFTELALFGRVTASGELELVNHLGIRLGDAPELVLDRVQRGQFGAGDIENDPEMRASDATYRDHVRDVNSVVPARFNADPRCLFEASGCAGKLVIFAVRLDTFPQEKNAVTFYIGTRLPDAFAELRRRLLAELSTLPISAEYLHADAFDIADRYGKDSFLLIRLLGTSGLPLLFAAKGRLDALVERLGLSSLAITDRLLQLWSRFWPDHLPPRMRNYRRRFDHHLILKVSRACASELRALLASTFSGDRSDYFECTEAESTSAFLHRYAAAGAAIRYRALHRRKVEEIIALDIALPRSTSEWFEKLPPEVDEQILCKLYYGHFLCHVFHQDYLVKKGENPVTLEHAMCRLLDARAAEYPAEHNVGHLYRAKAALRAFYREIDPRNQLNPGIGKTSKERGWRQSRSSLHARAIEKDHG